jgi:hypothetical protein
VARLARERRNLPAGAMVVCSAECYRKRVNRRTAALMREKQRTREAREQRIQNRSGRLG